MRQQHILQVSELTKKVRFLLESELNSLWLCGEISNFIAASSGHWYLSLKDQKAQVRCAMFKGNNRRVRITPRNGQQVLVRAKVSLYEPRGDFQLIIEQMEDAGEGLLRQQFEQLKNKLDNEGLFSLSHKQALPQNITKVGIVTSATGAAVKDILTVLQRRNPLIEAIIYPSQVQGQGASQEICQAISLANQRNECDLLIVGRGGGSLEDLWCFNEENVVRAIYHSQLPIISAVGHEIDTTLADYVSDLRAPTPSAAAELVSEDNQAVTQHILLLKQRLQRQQKQHLEQISQKLLALSHRLQQVHPEQKLRGQQQKFDELYNRLLQGQKNHFQQQKTKPQLLAQRLLAQSPEAYLALQKNKQVTLAQRLTKAQKSIYQSKAKQFATTIEQLHLVSPLATIARGYSIVKNNKKNIIRSVSEVNTGDTLTIQVKDGDIKAKVLE